MRTVDFIRIGSPVQLDLCPTLNYFVSRLARDHVTVLLTGEGADELYAGYEYLKQFDLPEQLDSELVKLTTELFSCNLRRCDRMTMAHGLEGRVPFLDIESVELALSIPAELKIRRPELIEKWVLRKAFKSFLPAEVIWRRKQQFSEGAGSAHFFAEWAEAQISDTQFEAETRRIREETGFRIGSKEELLYFREFRRCFPENAILSLVKPWRGH